MIKLTDSQLLDELKKRFHENKKSLYDLRVMTKKLNRLNEKLQESESLKSNFLSNIRNEMNDPLTSILGLSEQILSKKYKDNKTITTIAEMIHSEAFNLDFQLKNIFAAAEIEAGETLLDVSSVDVCALIKNTINFFRYRIDEKNLTIQFLCDSSKKKPIFKTDSSKLSLVIANLLSNAIGFSKKNGKIKLKAGIHNGSLAISVKDFGKGIKKANQKNIFDRFKQLDSGFTKSHRGHGIGLSIVKSIVEILKGDITLSSERNMGSVFKVTVPETVVDEEFFSYATNEFIYKEKEL